MVSVIVPVHNDEKTISTCIDSLLGQTYQDLELIIVDDGSGDTSLKQASIRGGLDRRIRVISQENMGVSAARNRGLDEANGEFVCFVDGDDTVSSNYVEVLLSMSEPGVMPVIDISRGDHEGSSLQPIDKEYCFGDSLPYEYFCGDLGQGIAYSVCNKLFRRSVLVYENIRFDEKLSVGEDMLFVYKYLLFCMRIHFSGDAVYHYVIRSGSAMASNGDYTERYEKLFLEMKKLKYGGDEIERSVLSRWAFNTVVWNIITNPYIVRKKYSGFRTWWKGFTGTEIYNSAMDLSSAETRKRKILYRQMKDNKTVLLFITLRLFRTNNKQEKRQ